MISALLRRRWHIYIRPLYEHVGLLEEQIEWANVSTNTRGYGLFSFAYTLGVLCPISHSHTI